METASYDSVGNQINTVSNPAPTNLGGAVSSVAGRTGAITLAKADVSGLENVDNTSDAGKPVSTAQATSIAAKEAVANKDTDVTLAANSDTKYPSQKAIKTYVDAVNDLGNSVLTVGSGGRYATIQAAVDYIATQPAFTQFSLWADGTVSAWAQDSDQITMATHVGHPSSGACVFPQSVKDAWLKVAGDTHYYPLDQINGQYASVGALVSVAMKRIEAATSGTPAVSWFTENKFTILVLDPVITETVTVSADMCVTITSLGSSRFNGAIQGASGFNSGRITFSNIAVKNYSVTGIWTGFSAANTIKLEFKHADIAPFGDDFIYPTQYLGSLSVEFCALNQQPSATVGHILAPGYVRGDVSIRKCSWNLLNHSALGISALSDGYLVDKCIGARNIIVEDIGALVRDTFGNFGEVGIVGSQIVGPKILATGINMVCPDTTAANFQIVRLAGTASGAAISIDGCSINAPNSSGTKKLISIASAPGGACTAKLGQNGLDRCDTHANLTTTYADTQAIAYGATITPDCASGKNVVVGTLTGNITINAPLNPRKGAILTLSYVSDATPRQITYNAAFKTSVVPISTGSTKASHLFVYDGTDWIQTGGALLWL